MRYLITLILILLSPALSWSTPSNVATSDTLVSGSSITITGLNFGTKPAAAPIKWETFDDGTSGETLAEGDPNNYWAMKTDGTTFPTYSSDNQRNENSSLNLFHTASSSGGEAITSTQFWKNNIGFESSGKAFINLWMRFSWVDTVPVDVNGYQFKSFRILREVSSSSGQVVNPSISNFNWQYDEDSYKAYYNLYGDQDYSHSGFHDFASVDRTKSNAGRLYGSDQWFNVQIQYSASTSNGGADATFKVWTQQTPNSLGAYDFQDATYCPGYTCSFDSPNPTGYTAGDFINAFKVDWTMSNIDGSLESIDGYIDDIYIDNTWARVEIGDAATYDACTHREIQIPSAWSNTSITATVNAGSFNSGEQLYLYVVDENGAVNTTGYAVTISGTPSSTTQLRTGTQALRTGSTPIRQ